MRRAARLQTCLTEPAMPVMTRTSLALLVLGSLLCGGLVAQISMQQATDEQVLRVAQQLVRDSAQAAGQVGGPLAGGLASTTTPAPELEKKESVSALLPPTPPPPTPAPASSNQLKQFRGKDLPPGVECNENGLCRNVGIRGASKTRDDGTDTTAQVAGKGSKRADALPPLPPPPPPPHLPSTYGLPPPPPPTPGALRGAGDHPESVHCDLKNKGGPENGVIFVDDPNAKALFKDDASYNIATSEKTGIASSI